MECSFHITVLSLRRFWYLIHQNLILESRNYFVSVYISNVHYYKQINAFEMPKWKDWEFSHENLIQIPYLRIYPIHLTKHTTDLQENVFICSTHLKFQWPACIEVAILVFIHKALMMCRPMNLCNISEYQIHAWGF